MKKTFISFILIFSIFILAPVRASAAFPLAESNSKKASEEAEEYYNKLPQGVRSAFETYGWRVIITDVFKVNYIATLYGGFQSGGYIAGYTESMSKSIVLSNTDAGASMNHEMGHFFDHILANEVSTSDQFVKIFNDESGYFDEGINDYAMSDPSEYFAEAFREYVECAGYLKKCCPSTYAVMDNLVSPYGGTQTASITEYQRCDSRLIEETAKQAANKLAELGVLAADKVLSGDKNPSGSKSLDEWLDKAKDTYQDIKDNPRQWGKDLADKANDKIQNSDPEAAGKAIADKINEKVGELNEKAENTDWEQKGRDAANKVKDFLEGMNP